jgi:hypothetical protein
VIRLPTKWLGTGFYHGAATYLIFWFVVFFAHKQWKRRREALEDNAKLGAMPPVNAQ